LIKGYRIPDATLERLAIYLRILEELEENGENVVSSMRLASICKINPAQVRKDLSYFGEFGVRGYGYEVDRLINTIKRILGTDREWKLCIVGIGNLGTALIRHGNFIKRGYRFMAAFDSDPSKHGKDLPYGLKIQPVSEMESTIKELRIEIGLITTPPSEAQKVADQLVHSGIRAIINFSPIQVRQKKECIVENVDFTVKLDNLAYHLSNINDKR